MDYKLFAVTVLGLLIGSFLNVCIYRIPRKLSVASPRRSFCPNCQTQLTWYDNIPVFSWILLNGKCRFCRKTISGKYPLVELLSAAMAVATYIHFGITPTGVAVFLLLEALLVMTFTDFELMIIPNVISFPGMTIGLLLGIVSQYTLAFDWPITKSAWDSLLGFLFGGGFFYAIGMVYYLVSKRIGLGGGDIKLLGMTGAIMGVNSVAPTIFYGSIIGAVIGIIMIIIKGGGRHTELPFGPWLSLAAILYIFKVVPPLDAFYIPIP